MIWLFCLVILPLIVALLLRWNSGVGFWVTYADRGRNEELFVSRSHRLRGKPDFIERSRAGIVPVEYKSHKGKVHQAFRNHVIQVLAYCFLLEDVYGPGKVTKGRVVYDEGSFDVPFRDKERVEIARIMSRMRMQVRGRAKRTHTEAGKCRSCAFQKHCDQKSLV